MKTLLHDMKMGHEPGEVSIEGNEPSSDQDGNRTENEQ
jgi:hypothetical protein